MSTRVLPGAGPGTTRVAAAVAAVATVEDGAAGFERSASDCEKDGGRTTPPSAEEERDETLMSVRAIVGRSRIELVRRSGDDVRKTNVRENEDQNRNLYIEFCPDCVMA